MEKSKKSPQTTKPSAKTKTGKLKAKLLSTYYGNPAKDLKLICITGTTGKSTVAHFVHEILRASDEHTAILASDHEIRVTTLHKFLNNAWKAGANYVVITAPAESLKKDTFYNLPIKVAALTNFTPASLDDPSVKDYLADSSILFKMDPEIIILNQDDAHYQDFAIFNGTKQTASYGKGSTADVKIENSTLYKKGTEAKLKSGKDTYNVASFLAGEPTVSYMACATAIAAALGLTPSAIEEGIANYLPETA